MFVFKHFPLISRSVVWLVLPLCLVALIGYQFLSRSTSKEAGTLVVSGLNQRVVINRDALGVPHIKASTDADAVFALGFVHAQDRLWQMEMNRRLGAGRLSEVIGIEAYRSDRFMRTLGLYKNATKMWRELSVENRDVLNNYVAGVNAGIAALEILPPEFQLYNYQPEPWQAVDSLLWMQLMTWQLSNNFSVEIQRALLVKALGRHKANELLPAVPDSEALQYLSQQSTDTLTALLGDYQNPYFIPKKYVGSNNWVVSGEHTDSGKPLLANDPHLVNALPAVWYLAKLDGDQLHTQGATFPGLPFVVIGQNQHIAWGVTNMLADTQDIYLEKINPLNRNQYFRDGQWQDMQVTQEAIHIKADFLRRPFKPRMLDVRRTDRGPLLSDISPQLENFAYSLRWTGDDQNGGTFNSYVKLSYAKNWQAFNDALSTFVAPAHNFVYADVEGNIGYLAPGKFPRRANNAGNGDVPALGWKPNSEWQGWVPFSEVPRVFNPAQGFVVTANNHVTQDRQLMGGEYRHHLGYDFVAPYRAQRISQLLTQQINTTNNKLTASHMQRIQADVLHPLFAEFKAKLLATPAKTEQAQAALALLQGWDGKMTLESRASTIFVSWMSHFQRLLINDDIEQAGYSGVPAFVLTRLQEQLNYPFLQGVMTEKHTEWCDFKKTQVLETCEQVLHIAFEHALNELDRTVGSDPDDWQWQTLHIAQLPHFPLSESDVAPHVPASDDSVFARVFHREIASPGAGETVNVAPISLADESKYMQFFGATYRQILDLSEPSQSQFMINTGQSGNRLSEHYDDRIEMHRDVVLLPIASDVQSRLTLTPSQSTPLGQ